MASVGSDSGQDCELNLAPIIDCFTVLIAFMLVSASFLSIGILDAGIAAAGANSTGATPPPVTLAIELKKDQSYVIKLSGKENRSVVVTAKDGKPDYDAMDAQLAAMKQKWPVLASAILSAENEVEYSNVVRSMEATRKQLPAVMLGGF